jgi:SAM-dependent methyltransferase
MAHLEQWRPERGTMLGIGCLEGGHALEVAQRRGWRVCAIEFSRIMAAYARDRLGVEVEVVEAWDLSRVTGRRFDVVYSHNFEHFLDPRTTLRHCRKLLADGGLLMLLDVPNTFHSLKNTIKKPIDDLMRAKARMPSHGRFPSEVHTYYFDPRTIRKLFSIENFEILELRTYVPRHPVYLLNPRFRWLQELIYAVGGLFDRGPSIEVIARPVRS